MTPFHFSPAWVSIQRPIFRSRWIALRSGLDLFRRQLASPGLASSALPLVPERVRGSDGVVNQAGPARRRRWLSSQPRRRKLYRRQHRQAAGAIEQAGDVAGRGHCGEAIGRLCDGVGLDAST